MNLDERISKANRNNERIKRLPPEDEEEETYIYDIRKATDSINANKNGVFDIKNQSGINTHKSVFDRGAFDTNGKF